MSPCVCRTVRSNCDNPINTCFGLNFYGKLKKKAGERAVSVKACPVGALSFDENGNHKIDLDKCLGCGICESNCPKHIGKMVYTESRVQKVTEPSRWRVWLSVLYVKLVFTPGVWFYKTFKGSMMHLMESDPRETDIISTKAPGYIHGGEQYACKGE